MILNPGKTAAIFGVRNDLSLAFAVALKLKESGCKVALSYLPETKEEVLFLAEKHGMDLELSDEVDVRNEEQIAGFLQKVHSACGPIDYLLHGAAYGNAQVMCSVPHGSGGTIPSYLDIPFDDLVDSFNISAYSLLRICRVAEPLLSEKASVLTLTYNGSQRVFPGYAGMGISKAALENIVLYLADHFRRKKIRVNAISAGPVMTTSAGGVSGFRKIRKWGKLAAPLGNIDAVDVANTALYYFSPLSEKVTGNIHFVDGGLNIMGAAGDGEQ
jgi:enoyl-[acyl-carrier protein] reductase I